jgi:hypothetical protein
MVFLRGLVCVVCMMHILFCIFFVLLCREELPEALEIRGHRTRLTQFSELRYRMGAWQCSVCDRSQPSEPSLWLYHAGPVGTADDTGYDCCVRCTMRGGWLKPTGEGTAADCEAGGIEAWLNKTGSCPTCREEYKPLAMEGGRAHQQQQPELRGPRPDEAKVGALTAMGFDEATARACLTMAFNDVQLAAQYCMDGGGAR